MKLNLSFASLLLVASGAIAVDMPVPADYDGDRKADPAMYAPGSGQLSVMLSDNEYIITSVGILPECIMIPGDYDGDGKADLAEYNPTSGLWFIPMSDNGYLPISGYTSRDAIPVPGDYDKDGKFDPATFESDSRTWTVYTSSEEYWPTVFQFPSYVPSVIKVIPCPGDFDGDGKTDPAVYIPSTGYWEIMESSHGYTVLSQLYIGLGGVPMIGDYDLDGKVDPARYKIEKGDWSFVLSTSYGYAPTYFYDVFAPNGIPTIGDYNGDGVSDLTVVHGKIWHIFLPFTPPVMGWNAFIYFP